MTDPTPGVAAGPCVALPWGAWFADTEHRLALPAGCRVIVHEPYAAPGLDAAAIAQAIAQPIDAPPLAELARGAKSACIVVDDLARPTPAGEIIPHVAAALHAAGIGAEAISVVVATGTHSDLSAEQLAWKVGAETVRRYRCEVHRARTSVRGTGIMYGSRELLINGTFQDASVKIVIGAAMPHSFAGYSGGAKLVLPGLADVDATARSHQFVQMGLRGGSDPNQNRFRTEIEALAQQLGVRFAICCVPNVRRQLSAIAAGDLVAAHRRACELAKAAYAAQVDGEYDALIVNAYPKDIDLIQAEGAFVALKTLGRSPVAEGGFYILATAASEGLGEHGLFAPGGANYREPKPIRTLGGRDLWIYAPSVSTDTVRQLYWEGYRHFRSDVELTAALQERLPAGSRIGVLPVGPMQQMWG